MITVQINTPQTSQVDTISFDSIKQSLPAFKNLISSKKRPLIKPSKSSINLSAADYEKFFVYRSNASILKSKIKGLSPPIDYKIILLCGIWYLLSAVSSNISKMILKDFPHPTTFTELQFLTSSLLCVATIFIVNNNRWLIKKFPPGTLPSIQQFENSSSTIQLIKPSQSILKTTLPMGIFQFIGHITTHMATNIIPVSLVHSVKALSPISTVLAYKIIFKKSYPIVTYLTLFPLMFGVMLTCFSNNQNKENSGFYNGLFFALVSMIIFVSQNIFAKKILTVHEDEGSLPTSQKVRKQDKEKIDKITILLYCSLTGFAFTLPVYLINEFSSSSFTILDLQTQTTQLILLHGVSHFYQAMLAFHLIGLMSPVNYSIANILKRIVVISMAMVWENQNINRYQGFGLVLTLAGLYSYDRWGIVKKIA